MRLPARLACNAECRRPVGWNVQGLLTARKGLTLHWPLGGTEMIVVDYRPDACIPRRLANHASPTIQLNRDPRDFDREVYRDSDRSVMTQPDGQRHAHTIGADARRLSLNLSGPPRATLPPDLYRKFHRNPKACTQIIHAGCYPITHSNCRRQVNPILPLLQVSISRRLLRPRPNKAGAGWRGCLKSSSHVHPGSQHVTATILTATPQTSCLSVAVRNRGQFIRFAAPALHLRASSLEAKGKTVS